MENDLSIDERILAVLKRSPDPMTTDTIAVVLGESGPTVRDRIKPLKRDGWIKVADYRGGGPGRQPGGKASGSDRVPLWSLA